MSIRGKLFELLNRTNAAKEDQVNSNETAPSTSSNSVSLTRFLLQYN